MNGLGTLHMAKMTRSHADECVVAVTLKPWEMKTVETLTPAQSRLQRLLHGERAISRPPSPHLQSLPLSSKTFLETLLYVRNSKLWPECENCALANVLLSTIHEVLTAVLQTMVLCLPYLYIHWYRYFRVDVWCWPKWVRWYLPHCKFFIYNLCIWITPTGWNPAVSEN